MKSLQAGEWTLGIVTTLLGLAGLVFPDAILGFLSFAVGAVLLICGAMLALKTLAHQTSLFRLRLALGIVLAVAGLIFIIKRDTPIRLFATLLGLWALASGALKLNDAIGLRQAGEKCTGLFLQSFINLGFGLYFLANPVSGTALWVRLLGLYLAYLGGSFLFSLAIENRNR